MRRIPEVASNEFINASFYELMKKKRGYQCCIDELIKQRYEMNFSFSWFLIFPNINIVTGFLWLFLNFLFVTRCLLYWSF